jgi:NTE family protein
MLKRKKIKVGLALGSGGSRGFAHIGVIETLKKEGIKIDFISGSSVGALIAAYYATHENLDGFAEKLIELSKKGFFQFVDPHLKGGLLDQVKINTALQPFFGNKKFSDTKIPLKIAATNLNNGQPKIFDKGLLSAAVRASCAVPFIFEPLFGKNERLVDGGLSDPVPVQTLRKAGADVVIAVNLYHKNEFIDKKFNLATAVFRSTRVLLYHLSQEKIKAADLSVNPDISKQVIRAGMRYLFSKEDSLEAIKIGEETAYQNMSKIKRLLSV